MTGTRKKMYETNTVIRKHLLANNFHHLKFFQHLRFEKDYHIGDCSFDGFGFNGNGVPYFFQFKTNKKAPKKEIFRYAKLEQDFRIHCAWVSKLKAKVLFQSVEFPEGKFLELPKEQPQPIVPDTH